MIIINIFYHYKISSTIRHKTAIIIPYFIGLSIPIILPFFPRHRFDECNTRIEQFLSIAEKSKFKIIQSFFVGMANHYIADSFYYGTSITDILKKQEYSKDFSKEISILIEKDKDIDTEITKTVNNYFKVENISGSIKNLYDIYEKTLQINYPNRHRVLVDYQFIRDIIEKVYLSIILF